MRIVVILCFGLLSQVCFSSPGEKLSAAQIQQVVNSIRNKNNIVVMVSVSKHTPFGNSLRTRHGFLTAIDHKGYYQKYYLQLSTVSELETLASEVHQDNGTCGGIEVLTSLTTTDIQDAYPGLIHFGYKSSDIEAAINAVSADKMKSYIETISALPSRYHSGAYASTAVSTIKSLWTSAGPTNLKVEEHQLSGTSSQSSLIASIDSQVDNTSTVIIGAHIDSINKANTSDAPGADDNASGIAAIAEILRVIKENSLTFDRRVEFHGYSAEEIGLVGSDSVASSYAAAKKKVIGMLQLDMVGYSTQSNDDNIYLVTDYTSSILRRQLLDLAPVYSIANLQEGNLASGTSDHKSWTKQGFHAVFPFENPVSYNPNIHSSKDKLDQLDLSLAKRFTKLALAWLSHSAGMRSTATLALSSYKSFLSESKESGKSYKIAITDRSTDTVRFAVSVPDSVSKMSLCRIQAETDVSCLSSLADLKEAATRNGKKIFVAAVDSTVTADSKWRISGYSSAGAIIGERDISIYRK